MTAAGTKHTCTGIAETGLRLERVFPSSSAGVCEWHLHVVSVGVRTLMYIIVYYCPFCGTDLERSAVQ